jgi:hypothetical protein
MSDSVDLHFPGLNYCGPGTNLNERLEADGMTPKPGYKPVDRIDEISLRHDIYYRDHPRERDRIKGDDIMLKELREIHSPRIRERLERVIVYPLLWIKRQVVTLWFLLRDLCSGRAPTEALTESAHLTFFENVNSADQLCFSCASVPESWAFTFS